MQDRELTNIVWQRLLVLNGKEKLFAPVHYSGINWLEVKQTAEKRLKKVKASWTISSWVYWITVALDLTVIMAVYFYDTKIEIYKTAILVFLTLSNATTRELDRVKVQVLEEQLFLISLLMSLQNE